MGGIPLFCVADSASPHANGPATVATLPRGATRNEERSRTPTMGWLKHQQGACFERLARAHRDTLISSARITHHVALTHQEPAPGLAKSAWRRDPARYKGEPRK